MSSIAPYPVRPPFFAMRFLRLLCRSNAAMEVGHDGLALLMAVVTQEDVLRYSRPVGFWNGHLAAMIGLRGSDEGALRRVRDKCIRAGWLEYARGNKQQSARYFVTIPAAISLLPDYNCDESEREYSGNTAVIQPQYRQESDKNPTPFIPTPTPTPIPTPNLLEKVAAAPRRKVIKPHVALNPPTLEEVAKYVAEIGGLIPASEFVDANCVRGWTYGKGNSPVCDWKAHYRTWNNRRKKDAAPVSSLPKPTLEQEAEWGRIARGEE